MTNLNVYRFLCRTGAKESPTTTYNISSTLYSSYCQARVSSKTLGHSPPRWSKGSSVSRFHHDVSFAVRLRKEVAKRFVRMDGRATVRVKLNGKVPPQTFRNVSNRKLKLTSLFCGDRYLEASTTEESLGTSRPLFCSGRDLLSFATSMYIFKIKVRYCSSVRSTRCTFHIHFS